MTPPGRWRAVIRLRVRIEGQLIGFCLGQQHNIYFPSDFANKQSNINEDEMPRAKTNKNPKTGQSVKRGAGKTAWVNVKLDDTDVLEIERMLNARLEVFNDFAAIQVAGGDIGVKWVDDGQSVMAYCIVDDVEVDNQRCGLSAYATDAFEAIACLCYKYYHKLGSSVTAGDTASKPRFG